MTMAWFSVFVLVALAVFGEVGGEDDVLQWFKNVNDVNFVCDDLDGELLRREVAEKPLFEVVDCGAKGARYDYKFKAE